MAELISIDEARGRVVQAVRVLETEDVALADALERVLARDVESPTNVPPFDNSAVDGFAVEAGPPAELQLIGESRAGHPSGRNLRPGAAVRISTGAEIPVGATAVVPVERARASSGRVRVEGSEQGENIRRAGEDVRGGDLVLRAGTLIGPAELGVAASIGRDHLPCARRPRVAVLVTGDELAEPGHDLGPGRIYSSNAFALAGLVARSRAAIVSRSTVRDSAESTREALENALGAADVICVSGGVSVGPHDHVKPVLRDLGVTERFWGVALRPGKPTWFGTRNGTLVFGLPGNPVSSMVTFLLFARPAIDAQLGLDPARSRGCAALAESLPLLAARTQAVRCSLELSERGWTVTTTGPQGSHVLTSMLGADCLAFVPPGEGELEAGAEVEFELLPGATVGGGGRGTLT
jgi:molybdopterin molybdotransferase